MITPEEMIKKRENEKKWWESWVGAEYGQALSNIRRQVTKIWEEQEEKRPLPFFTPHGPEHCKAVEHILHELIPGQLYELLEEEERFYLLAAAWLHDIGLIRSVYYEVHRGESNVPDSVIRDKHHLTSEKYISEHYKRCGFDYDHSEKDCYADKSVVALISRYHRTREDINRCHPTVKMSMLSKNIRLQLLSAYLRLADALHIDNSRVPNYAYAICLAYNMPQDSQIHWIKSKLVQGILLNHATHEIHVTFRTPTIEQLAERKVLNPEWVFEKIDYIINIVKKDLEKELGSVTSILSKAGISWYMDIKTDSKPMYIEEQVLTDLLSMTNNYDIMDNPSSSRLAEMVLTSVANMAGYYLVSENKDSPVKVTEISPEKIEKDFAEFFKHIRENLLNKRKCHFGLVNLIKNCETLSKKYLPDNLTGFIEEIDALYQNHYRSRKIIRRSAQKFFEWYIEGEGKLYRKMPEKLPDKPPDEWPDKQRYKQPYKFSLSNFLDKDYFHAENFYQDIQSQSDSSTGRGTSKENIQPPLPINILLFGYSNLTIQSLCGFRDNLIMEHYKALIKDKYYDKETYKYSMEKFHESLSEGFRIFVCDGQPKTNIQENQLLFHDGFSFVSELIKKNFKNIVLIPDILSRNVIANPGIDLIMMGTNGFNQEGFFHSGGHLSLIKIAEKLKEERKQEEAENNESPHIVLVVTMDKFSAQRNIEKEMTCANCKEKCRYNCVRCVKSRDIKYAEDKEKKCNEKCERICNEQCDECKICEPCKQFSPAKTKEEVVGGFHLWKPDGVVVRNNIWFLQDEEIEKSKEKFKLYNPREDNIPFKYVDFVISDLCNDNDDEHVGKNNGWYEITKDMHKDESTAESKAKKDTPAESSDKSDAKKGTSTENTNKDDKYKRFADRLKILANLENESLPFSGLCCKDFREKKKRSAGTDSIKTNSDNAPKT